MPTITRNRIEFAARNTLDVLERIKVYSIGDLERIAGSTHDVSRSTNDCVNLGVKFNIKEMRYHYIAYYDLKIGVILQADIFSEENFSRVILRCFERFFGYNYLHPAENDNCYQDKVLENASIDIVKKELESIRRGH